MHLTRRRFIQAGAVASGLVFADAVGFERYFVETKEFYLGDSTAKTSNIKIVQISDLHIRSIRFPHRVIAKRINKLKPDLVAFTGDSVDRHSKLWVLEHFLKLLDTGIQKVAVLGNWEYWSTVGIESLDKLYADYNCRLLVNQTTQFSFQNKTLSVTGLDDFVAGKPDIEKAVTGYKKSDYHIILNHCPKYADTISEKLSKDIPVDFILSGHTHGGQVNLFGFVAFLPEGSGSYVKGWYYKNAHKLYVSKGIGTTMLPVRVGARSEIAIFNLKA